MKYIKLNLITAKCLLCTHVSQLCVGNYAIIIENPNPNVTLKPNPEVYTKGNGSCRSLICTLPGLQCGTCGKEVKYLISVL